MSLSTNLKSAIHDPRPTWHNPRIVATLLLVFLAGASAGAIAVRLSAQRAATNATVWREAEKESYLNKLRKELDLTPDQAREIELVLDDFTMYYQSLQSQMDDVRANGKQQIRRILSEDQRKKFDGMLEQFRGKIR